MVVLFLDRLFFSIAWFPTRKRIWSRGQ